MTIKRMDNVLIVFDDVVSRVRARGAKLIGEMQYEDAYRLAYIRGPESIVVALAQEL